MNSEQIKTLCFYCWQLNIKTLEQLAKWKAQHNARNNAETLEAMAKAYNGVDQNATKTKHKHKTKK